MNQELATRILGVVGGRPNILQISSCMTRLRLVLRDSSIVNRIELSKIAGVMGVVEADEQLQIVIGPGKVKLVASEMEKQMREDAVSEIAAEKQGIGHATERKAAIAARNRTPLKVFLGRIAAIFVPLIPAIVASGMVAGLTNVAIRCGIDPKIQLIQILDVIGWGLFGYLAIFVGFQTAKEFGGTPALGGLAGVLLINPAISVIQIDGYMLIPGRGGVFGVLLVAGFMVWLEHLIRRHVPQSIDIIVTPTLTLLGGGFATYFLLQPVSGLLSDGVVWFFRSMLESGGILAGMILAGSFLPLVITGLHQGLTPVHMELLQTMRANPLLPVLAMAGAGQVGAAMAILAKTKNSSLRKIVKAALPVGFLGIGEPLIFGVTLPLGKPFLSACIGAAAGGAFQAAMHVESISMGVSGLPLVFLIRSDQMFLYLCGLFIAYTAGFAATWIVGFDDPVETTKVEGAA